MLKSCHWVKPPNALGSAEYGVAEPAAILSVPPRWLARPGSTVTQALAPTGATAVGWFPTRISRDEPVSGSIRETVPSRLLATQTESSPNATPAGAFPTVSLRMRPLLGS